MRSLVALAFAVLEGCVSTPMAWVSDRAKPSRVIQNRNGATMFDFMFPTTQLGREAAGTTHQGVLE